MRKTAIGKALLSVVTAVITFAGMTAHAEDSTAHPGDIAFTAFHTDRDAFAIVTLVDLPADTTIFFTDEEWGGDAFVSADKEADVEWNSGSSVVTAGTTVVFDYIDSTDNWTVSTGTINSSEGMSLSKSGEDIYAYYGDTRAPTAFLAAISSTTPNLDNTGLVIGETAVSLSQTPAGQEYTGVHSGETAFADYLTLINDSSNWSEIATAPSRANFSIGTAVLTPSVTVNSPSEGTEFTYDTAIVKVSVSQSNIDGGIDYINETLGTTQTVDAVSAYMSLAEGNNVLVISGTNTLGETASDSITVVRGSGSDGHIALSAVGTIELAGAEIVAFDDNTATAFVTTPASGLVLVDLSDPMHPSAATTVLTNELINSVAVHDGIAAVAVESGTNTAGQVVFLNASGTELNRVTVGILPDMVTFSPDGTKVITADEAETGEHEDWGAGSISVIDLSAGVSNAAATVLDFTAFDSQTNELVNAGVRLFPGRLPSVDFEPEYVAVSPDGSTAFVTLQENNAFAVVDLSVPEITEIIPLGLKDWSLPENTMDASDKDGEINMANYPVFGMYMPDSVAAFDVGGSTWYVTANEGDSRDFGSVDEARVEDLVLDTNTFPNATSLQAETALGRLKVSKVNSDPDNDGDVDVLYSYGARSFSIWDSTGTQVYDSADDFESYLAAERPELFNINDSDPGEFDKRSDDKGCEPEAAAVGVIDGVTYAFIGLERVGGVMVYNVSNPQNPSFVEFVRLAGDAAPEGFKFVTAEDSPNGKPLLLVANEDSYTLTVYETAINTSAATTNGTPVNWLAQNNLTPADDNLDADDDGLDNAGEYAASTDPQDPDSDDDQMADGWEIDNGFDPLESSDASDDADVDGLDNAGEYAASTDPQDPDSDDDQMADGWEIDNGFDPLESSDASDDADVDGLDNAGEYAASTDPYRVDTDFDLIPDGYEVNRGMSPVAAQTLSSDADSDGCSDIEEYNSGTDPNDRSDRFILQAGVSNNLGSLRFQVGFASAAGHRYVVQTSDDLRIWNNNLIVDGSNDVVNLDDPVAGSRFYRVAGAIDSGAPSAKICVISDTHYLAPSLLNTNSPDFQAYLEEDRKLIAESHDIMESTVDAIIAEQPDILLVAGDLTKDGELVCHQALSNCFAAIEAAGIDVIVCPGNHDINNTNAVQYNSTGSVAVASITAEEFAENYDHCGYGEAISRDPDSLSFVTEPVDGLWIMSVDSCLYTPTQVTGGEVSASTLTWMEGVMADAAAGNKTVLAMMHHGVVPHYAYQTMLFPDYVVSNHVEVAETLVSGGVGAVFTGHYHANDVVRDESGLLFDIETGSTVTWPCPYRVIFLTADGVLNITTKHIEEVAGFDDFQTYAKNYLYDGMLDLSKNLLMSQYGVDEDTADTLAPAVAASFVAHYAGDEGVPDDYTQAVTGQLTGSANELNQVLGAAIGSIWNDPAPADNNVLVNTRHGGAVAK
jgi:hypothetical protein